MIAVNYSTARDNFKRYCDSAALDCETVVITRKNGRNVVLISEEAYGNLMENLYIRSDRKDYEQLLKSIEQLKAGKGTVHELALAEDDE